MNVRFSLRNRLFLTFAAFLVALVVPLAAVLVLVNTAYRDLSEMQSHQIEISFFITATDSAYDNFSRYLYNGEEKYRADFLDQTAMVQAGIDRLDRELPAVFHYNFYDLRSMVSSFQELADEIRTDYMSGTARIFLDKRMTELARLRNYLRAEYTRLLTSYIVHVQGRSVQLRHSIDASVVSIVLVIGVMLFLGAVLAARLSRGIAAPVQELARSLARFSSGDLDVPPLEVRRSDEIGVVVNAFNTMTTEIRAYVAAIKGKAAVEAALADQTLRALQAENALKHAEMRYLQAQVNPHFLYNSLNSILSLARIECADRTTEACEDLAVLLRAALRSGRAMARLEDEFEIVRHYLRIQKVRFGRRLEFALDLPRDLRDVQIPSMIVQPFVENAVIHGIEPRESGGTVEVEARRDGCGATLVIVRDDGAGFDPQGTACSDDQHDDGQRIGIDNVRRRLALIFGEARQLVSVESAPAAGTTVRILIPTGS